MNDSDEPTQRQVDPLRAFWQNCSALRQYARLLLPYAAETAKRDLDAAAQLGVEVQQFLESHGTEVRREGDKTSVTFEAGDQATIHRITERLLNVQRALRDAAYVAKVVPLLARSALITLVSFFELLESDLMRMHLQLHPQALSDDTKQFSVNDLKLYSDMLELVNDVIAKKVETISRDSLENRAKLYERLFKATLGSLSPSGWPEFNEIFERRNLLVHNDGLVNKIYLSKVGSDYLDSLGKDRPSLGDRLEVRAKYLYRAIYLLTASGMKLGDTIWGSLAKADLPKRDGLLAEAVYECLKGSRWRLGADLSRFMLDRGTSSDTFELTATVNYWLCMKRLGKFAEVRDAIERFDADAHALRFALALSSLREDADEFFRLLPQAVATGVLRWELVDWPVLEEMRKDPRFQTEVGRLAPAEDEPANNSEVDLAVQPSVGMGVSDSDGQTVVTDEIDLE